MNITNERIDAILLAIDENSTVEFPVEGLAQHATTLTDYEPIREAVAELVHAECKQLQQDKAELVEAFQECYEWLDGQLTSEYQFELDKFKAVLEKHKCD